MLEIAHNLADIAHDGEGFGVFPDDIGQDADLGFVDDADQNVGLVAGIHAFGGHQGGAVVQPGDDGVGQLLRIVGDTPSRRFFQ